MSGRSNGYDDPNSLGRKLLQSGECSSILLLDTHSWFIMTMRKLSRIVRTDGISLALPAMQSAFLYSWCCSFAQAALHTQCYCRSISVFAFTYLAAYMSSNALQPVDGDSAPLGLCVLVQVRSRLLAAMHRPLRMRPMQMLLTPSLMTLWVSYCNMSSIVHDPRSHPLEQFRSIQYTLQKFFALENQGITSSSFFFSHEVLTVQ